MSDAPNGSGDNRPTRPETGGGKENNNLFDETVVGLYDAATDVDKWPAFIELMARLFEAEVSWVVYWDIEQDHLTFEAIRGLGHIPPKRSRRHLQLSWIDIHVVL